MYCKIYSYCLKTRQTYQPSNNNISRSVLSFAYVYNRLIYAPQLQPPLLQQSTVPSNVVVLFQTFIPLLFKHLQPPYMHNKFNKLPQQSHLLNPNPTLFKPKLKTNSINRIQFKNLMDQTQTRFQPLPHLLLTRKSTRML